MEILGFEGIPEHDFHEKAIDKSQDPRFLDLLEDNKFLGTGKKYLCSDQIIKVRFLQCWNHQPHS